MGGYNRPVRRYYLEGYNRPVMRYFLGDSAAAVTPYDLNDWSVEDFLSRHPDTMALTNQFDAIVMAHGYKGQTENNNPNLTWLQSLLGFKPGTDYPIAEWGISVPDPVYGNVVIFPDASGQLHYSAGVSNQLAANINAPPIESPSGNPQSINDFLHMLQAALDKAGKSISSAVPYLVVGGVIVVGALLFGGNRK